ncbi:MAG: PilZ domain-containing protein [Candidatus Hydrogenedentes bacterium]|nr:PilZ domain-containing protein [Candidatus Hydrogenedentota bacterium]
MSSSYNQRAYTRIETTVTVTTEPSMGLHFDAGMLELSAGGMSLEHPPMLPPDTAVVCSFFTTSQRLITLRGAVSWARDGRFGVRFTGYDTASYLNFKEFLFEQAADRHTVENEIQLNLDNLPEAD